MQNAPTHLIYGLGYLKQIRSVLWSLLWLSVCFHDHWRPWSWPSKPLRNHASATLDTISLAMNHQDSCSSLEQFNSQSSWKNTWKTVMRCSWTRGSCYWMNFQNRLHKSRVWPPLAHAARHCSFDKASSTCLEWHLQQPLPHLEKPFPNIISRSSILSLRRKKFKGICEVH